VKRAALSFPTAALAGDLARAFNSPIKPALPSAATILQFFDAHPDFELGSTSIQNYLDNKVLLPSVFLFSSPLAESSW
jgi:hypothetical protein